MLGIAGDAYVGMLAKGPEVIDALRAKYLWQLNAAIEETAEDLAFRLLPGGSLPVSYTHLTLPTTPYV